MFLFIFNRYIQQQQITSNLTFSLPQSIWVWNIVRFGPFTLYQNARNVVFQTFPGRMPPEPFINLSLLRGAREVRLWRSNALPHQKTWLRPIVNEPAHCDITTNKEELSLKAKAKTELFLTEMILGQPVEIRFCQMGSFSELCFPACLDYKPWSSPQR